MQAANACAPPNPAASDRQQTPAPTAMGFGGAAPLFGIRPPPFPGMHPHFAPPPDMFPPNAFPPPNFAVHQGCVWRCKVASGGEVTIANADQHENCEQCTK
eukprot:3459678-Rhodomonas_salina.1